MDNLGARICYRKSVSWMRNWVRNCDWVRNLTLAVLSRLCGATYCLWCHILKALHKTTESFTVSFHSMLFSISPLNSVKSLKIMQIIKMRNKRSCASRQTNFYTLGYIPLSHRNSTGKRKWFNPSSWFIEICKVDNTFIIKDFREKMESDMLIRLRCSGSPRFILRYTIHRVMFQNTIDIWAVHIANGCEVSILCRKIAGFNGGHIITKIDNLQIQGETVTTTWKLTLYKTKYSVLPPVVCRTL